MNDCLSYESGYLSGNTGRSPKEAMTIIRNNNYNNYKRGYSFGKHVVVAEREGKVILPFIPQETVKSNEWVQGVKDALADRGVEI